MQISTIIAEIEQFAPTQYQEDYDNSGLIVGSINTEVESCLVCLDVTEEIIQEAIKKECKLIISHHPIVFSGLKKITGKTYTERIIIEAIKHNIAIYAVQTNFRFRFRRSKFQDGRKAKP
jgi:putative NIF3 family GTP cyclohydrolase 1 type 2